MTSRKLVAGAAQQVHAVVVGEQLQIVEALVEDFALERLAVGGGELLADHRAAEIPRLETAEEAGERLHFGVGDLTGRHSLPRQSVADEGD